MMRVLIADDEAPARARLRRLLAAHSDVEVCGEAGTGWSTLAEAERLRPDAILLDIQMPEATGMEVAASLKPPAPRIIFVTAYDRYAVEAFRLHALDYLLKPVTAEQLAEAVERLKRERPAQELPRVSRLLVKCGGHVRVVDCGQTECFISEGGETRVFGRGAGGAAFDFYLDLTLNQLETRLDPAGFVRVSRTAILRVSEVRKLQPEPRAGGVAVLSSGRAVGVSRRRWAALVEAVAGNRQR